jgi:hypothetical protein
MKSGKRKTPSMALLILVGKNSLIVLQYIAVY